jgi:hypothetical protein
MDDLRRDIGDMRGEGYNVQIINPQVLAENKTD